MDAVNPSDETLLAWLTLLRAPGVGPRGLWPLLQRCPDPAALLDAPPPDTPEKIRKALREADREQAARDLDWLRESGNQALPCTDPAYPELLRKLPDPPVLLFLRGDAQLLGQQQIAIVGSRHASRGGLDNARAFARHLAGEGFPITSGLAAGIDGAAHEGALEGGHTLAVLGTGLDRVFPAQHRELAHRIAEQGLLVSEFPPGTPPLPGNFPRRNRVIAGLTFGTLVVEAVLKSGSLITARLAAELGREVFAIPGSIHNPLARGCHALIREGAKLLETSEHVIEELLSLLLFNPPATAPAEEPPAKTPALDPDHAELLELMGFDPVSSDWLVANSRFSAAEISSMLLLLELQGHVSSGPGGLFTRLGKPLS
ncbi:DNA-processing protein DprA [endosymbiont of unidentified scaly snail isolate Monju]|uniref:DNA-processing protein DprA n=1 Tax=endosymbiont of unidentified scaly snail isolate Monju TaxID=1248727 RepID=UPI0003891DAA|nr:DNA-processing protein DprA [endosymbiont of unidentified scaly snail isolate Monju]BAN68098.1 DNA processing protein [endosymbiont of unidentified scaly snail isolate Monju]